MYNDCILIETYNYFMENDMSTIDEKIKRLEDIQKSILYQIKHKTTPKFIFGEYLKDKNLKSNLMRIALTNYFFKVIDKTTLQKLYENIYFIRTNQYKYIRYGEKIEEFYDLSKNNGW